jgi:hypothetical protein
LKFEPKESTVIYDSWNLGSVDNNPACSPFLELSALKMEGRDLWTMVCHA